MNRKIIFLVLSAFNFLLFFWVTFHGFTAFKLEETFAELNIQLPLYTQLWVKFWWLLSIIFLALAIWMLLKYKKIK